MARRRASTAAAEARLRMIWQPGSKLLHNLSSVQVLRTRTGARAGTAAVALLLALALAACGEGSTVVIKPAPKPKSKPESRIAEERPPRPRHLDVARRRRRRRPPPGTKRLKPPRSGKRRPPRRRNAKRRKPNQNRLPNRHSATARRSAPGLGRNQRLLHAAAALAAKEITPRVIERLERQEAEGRAVLLSGIALAPPSAPKRIKARDQRRQHDRRPPLHLGRGARLLVLERVRLLGRGQLRPRRRRAVLEAPLDSTRLEAWGDPGPGRWVTVYANAGTPTR